MLKPLPSSLPASYFWSYAEELRGCLKTFDWERLTPLFHDLRDALNSGRRVYICGNGGSAGNANHLANDFIYPISKKRGVGLKVHSLSSNPATITCLANDEGYEQIYSMQLEVLAEEGDILLVFSGSGNSKNIENAILSAKNLKMRTYAILGFDGGVAKELVDHPIHLQTGNMQIAEDFQTICGHMVVRAIYELLQKDEGEMLLRPETSG